MRRAAVLTTVAVLLAALSCAAWADAAGRAGAGPALRAEPATVRPGGTVVLKGHGFPRNATIALLAGPPHSEADPIGRAQTGRRGGFTATIRIRPQAAPGRLVALACHDDCRIEASVRFRIVSP